MGVGEKEKKKEKEEAKSQGHFPSRLAVGLWEAGRLGLGVSSATPSLGHQVLSLQ